MNELFNKFKALQDLHLDIDMTRGKPCKEQLDLSMPMMDVLNSKAELKDSEGFDCRNYGKLDGLKECKKLLADMIEVDDENIIIFGNSSLHVMYECLADSFLYGVLGNTPWSKLDHIKWLCPVPGYDRHFAMCEALGIEMINIPMDSKGPDMDLIEKYIKDPSVKGIWCVPKYSNPDGTTYSEAVVKRFARLKPAAPDFRIYWDNAYSVHHLYEKDQDFLLEIINECKRVGNPDLVYKFTSTSKISFPGSGIAALAASPNNIASIKEHLKYKTIGYDKVNQLRHVRFFKDLNGVKEQMRKHADILRPKFELVNEMLEKELKGIATWTKPKGGYFVSLYVDGKAKEVIDKCKTCGVKLTEAGCAYPYHKDPSNAHIRIAPSYLSLAEIKLAMEVICLAVKIEMAK